MLSIYEETRLKESIDILKNSGSTSIVKSFAYEEIQKNGYAHYSHLYAGAFGTASAHVLIADSIIDYILNNNNKMESEKRIFLESILKRLKNLRSESIEKAQKIGELRKENGFNDFFYSEYPFAFGYIVNQNYEIAMELEKFLLSISEITLYKPFKSFKNEKAI